MNKFTKIFAGVVLAGSSAMASASPLFLNPGEYDVGLGAAGDADSYTYTFDEFTFNSIDPLSAYLDLEGDGIEDGTIVFDSAQGEVGLLNPADGSAELFPILWQLEFEYELWGYAVTSGTVTDDGILEDGESLAASFVGGYYNMYFDHDNDASTASELLLTLSLSSSDFNVEGGVNFTLFADIDYVIDDFFYMDPGLSGFSDLSDIVDNVDPSEYYAVIDAEITDATEIPSAPSVAYTPTIFQNTVLAALDVDLDEYANEQWLTRTTTLPSANLAIEVSAPASVALMGLGLIGLGGIRRFKKA